MDNLQNINNQYDSALTIYNLLDACKNKIMELKGSNKAETEIVIDSIKYVSNLSKKIDLEQFLMLNAFLNVGEKFYSCQNSINNYKSVFLNEKDIMSPSLKIAKTEIKESHNVFLKTKKDNEVRFNCSIKTEMDLYYAIITAIQNAVDLQGEIIEIIKKEAREIVEQGLTSELRIDDPICMDDCLPESFLVAQSAEPANTYEVLEAIGISDRYSNIGIDLKKSGNVFVSLDFNSSSEKMIDNFAVSYILRYISSFPLGKVVVHIFDNNTDILYKRISNCFSSEDAGETAKKVIQIHTTLSDLEKIRDVHCEDILRKTTAAVPDLYSMYDTDNALE